MEKSAVILGLSRQAKFLGLPMPYAMAVGAMTVLPFILFKPVWWFLTAPVWYGLARVATKLIALAPVLPVKLNSWEGGGGDEAS